MKIFFILLVVFAIVWLYSYFSGDEDNATENALAASGGCLMMVVNLAIAGFFIWLSLMFFAAIFS